MTPKIFSFSEQSPLFKTIEVVAPTSYSHQRYMQLGFIPMQPGSFTFVDAICSSVSGRVSPVTLEEAERVAQLISEVFYMPVSVIKELKVPCHTQDEVVEKDANGNLQPKGNLRPENVWAPTALLINNLSHYREIIQLIEHHHFITVQDRAALNPFIKEVEKQLTFAAQLTQEISTMQKDILRSFCEPYIDAIIEACDKTANKEALLGKVTWSKFDAPYSKRDLALCVLIEAMQKDVNTLFSEKFEGLQASCAESGTALHLIYTGQGELESTFSRSGAGVPYLRKQREALLAYVEEKLTEKFGPEPEPAIENNRWNRAYLQALRARLFSEGYQLDPIGNSPAQQNGPDQLILQPFVAVFDALTGNFGETMTTYENRTMVLAKHFWIAEDGEKLEGETARNRFLQIQREVEDGQS